jgi:protocatechuate 3,4-dioxygenase beta subunit
MINSRDLSAVLALVFVGVAIVALLHAPSVSKRESSILASFPLAISGHVYDSGGSPVAGAVVYVASKLGSTTYANLTKTSDGNGFYTVTFAPTDWDTGYTIEAYATYGSYSAINSTTASGAPTQVVDVHFSVVIPEFTSFSVVAVMTVAISLIGIRLRKGKNPGK